MSYLVIAAHPDDEVLGCGGTIARLARQGEKVAVAILGEGITSRYASPSQATASELKDLHANSARALNELGVDQRFQFGFPDNRFDTVALLDIIKCIEDVIETVRPKTLFTQHGGDLNIDHSLCFRATLTAARSTPDSTIQEVLTYQVPSATDWSFAQFAPRFLPNLFYDISDTLDQKIEAMQCYESEARAYPHPRSPKALRAIAQQWGSQCGCDAAEAYCCIRSLR